MKQLLLLSFLSFCCIDIYAQSPQKNLDKYWEYRDRFLGKDGGSGFIDLGMEAGQSLPMSGRAPNADCLGDWHINHHNCDKHKGSGKIEWGDGTVWLGYYLATLSLEYANLEKSGEDLSEISKELYFALYAYERLDRTAEMVLGMSPEYNGFFIRDDVPSDFYKSDDNNLRRRFRISRLKGYDCVQSDYSCGNKNMKIDDGGFASQDQILALLYGFTFVKKFAAKGKFKTDKRNFGEMAMEYTDKIAGFCVECNWKLKGPRGEKISNRWGGDLRAFNFLIAKTANKITEGRYRKNYFQKKGIGRMIAGSYNWGFGMQSYRNHALIFDMVVTAGEWNAKKIAKRSRKADMIIFALAYSAINDVPLHKSISKEELFEIANSAPWDGPCFQSPGCRAPEGWRSSDRWWHAKHKNGNPYGLKFEWSGMDYMLFYNLLHHLYKDELPRYQLNSN